MDFSNEEKFVSLLEGKTIKSMTGRNSQNSFFSNEIVIKYGGLIFAIVFVGLLYSLIIRPQAEKIERNNRVLLAQDAGKGEFVPDRSVSIIIKNPEQQICFTLLVWAVIMVSGRSITIHRIRRNMGEVFIEVEDGERIIPEEALSHAKHLDSRLQNDPDLKEQILPKNFLTSLRRFHSTHSIQEVSQSVREISDSEAERMDSDLSLPRLIIGFLPMVGFIGTVRGIAQALTNAEKAIRGDIQGVTENLGLAFNSTFVALILSIVLMVYVHYLQTRQENLIFEVQEYCRDKLVALMKIPFKDEGEIPMTQNSSN